MDADSDLLLSLYREARVRPTSEFQDFAVRSIQPSIAFASAVWTTGYRSGAGKNALLVPILGLSRTYNTDPAGVDEWRAINRADKTIPIVFANPFRTQRIHTPTLFAVKADAVMRDYARRFGRQNALITSLDREDTPLVQWCSIYRPGADDTFSTDERARCQNLMLHMAEALKVNRLVQRTRVVVPGFESEADGNAALVAPTGHVLSAQEGFLTACRLQWPGFDGRRMPDGVMRQIVGMPHGAFRGRHLVLRSRRIAEFLWLTITPPHADAVLPPRRMDVATLFADGHTHKQIARALGISPSTVRNHLAASYRDLGVANRNDLKRMLKQGTAIDR